MLAAEILYKGAIALADATSGYAQANDGTTITIAAGDIFIGIVEETADNSTGAAGDIKVRVIKHGEFQFTYNGGGLTQGNIGDKVYCNDTTGDGEVGALTGGVDVEVGEIVEIISATVCRVKIDNSIGSIAA
ncbi:MAG: hypothetical protein V3U02_04565 [Calditrichia bacterium]